MPTTLITGASSGIGAEFARRFAARGDDLVLVARKRDRLEALGRELQDAHGIACTSIAQDLTSPNAPETLAANIAARAIEVDTLVNNAGFATHGDVGDADPHRLNDEIAVNCQALVGITTRLLPGMLARGGGTIVNIASTAAFQPVPHMAVYSATKAFVLNFSEALEREVRNRGIRVLAVCPGSTDTAFFDVAGEAAVVGRKRTPQQVVDHTMRELGGSKASFIDGVGNAFVARVVTRLLPRKLLIAAAGRSVSSS